ncbi:MAG: HAMP domain-containing histidine kinase, partial [Paracoccaceae bacterium]|nr:HAMP domain-containing histidine kinase [Paracoccaceae bacterium]
MRQQTRRLTSLIDDLLLLAQADAGTMFLERGKLDLVPLIESACDDLQTLADGKDISVEQDLPATLVVSADRRRLSMILQNLVENAAKYTPDGGRVRVSGGTGGDGVAVTVANT